MKDQMYGMARVTFLKILLMNLITMLSAPTQGNTLIRDLNATFNSNQRHNVPFTVQNTTNGKGQFTWHALNLDTLAIDSTKYARNPTFTLPEGHYLLYGEVQGRNPNPVARVFWDKR